MSTVLDELMTRVMRNVEAEMDLTSPERVEAARRYRARAEYRRRTINEFVERFPRSHFVMWGLLELVALEQLAFAALQTPAPPVIDLFHKHNLLTDEQIEKTKLDIRQEDADRYDA